VTFGSFNALLKISDDLLGLWARVLAAAPGSRLLIKARGLEPDDARLDLAARAERAGIAGNRLELRGGELTVAEHLARYHEVEVALDSFPYHGTTTTCEAMWMGVPVVTLVGGTHASRVGLSLLSAVGLEDLAAKTGEEYVATAAGLAADASRRGALRAGLRERMSGSALCDAAGFGKRISGVMQDLWRDRCAKGVTAAL
jgi:predicted O-linked N-acetylglucosamine transferase (SPINDLY family)